MISTRIEKLRQSVTEHKLDALLITSLPNIFYLSGFTGSTAMLLISPEKRWFITDFRYHEQVSQQVDSSYTLIDNTGAKLVEEVLPKTGLALGRVGFEAAHMPQATYSSLAEAASFEWVSLKGAVEELRMVKDAAEIELLRQSQALNERVLLEVLGTIGPDTTEADLAAEISYRAMKHGALKVSFDPIVASGTNSSKPHAGFTSHKLVPGTPLTIDMGVLLNNYASDMTRTVFYKDCPPKWAEIYVIVKTAQEMAFDAIAPGKTGREIDAVARDYIYGKGYDGKFGHGLGHGIGIEVHEQPRLSNKSDQALEPGNVVSNEPGIYLPGEGGIRIEDLVVVTADGAENLNNLDREIKVVG